MTHIINKIFAILATGALMLTACKSGTTTNDTLVDSAQLANEQTKQALIGEWQPVRMWHVTDRDSGDIVTNEFPWRYCFMENDTLYIRSNAGDEKMIHNRAEWIKNDDGTFYLIESWSVQSDTIFLGFDNNSLYPTWHIDSLSQECLSVSALDDRAEMRRISFEKAK